MTALSACSSIVAKAMFMDLSPRLLQVVSKQFLIGWEIILPFLSDWTKQLLIGYAFARLIPIGWS